MDDYFFLLLQTRVESYRDYCIVGSIQVVSICWMEDGIRTSDVRYDLQLHHDEPVER